jgi:predicted nucleic-acid-binding protein
VRGIDTNVLVRFLVDDDEKQGSRARRLIRQAVDDGESLFVSDIVLCELVWVLTAAYGFSRNVVATTLDGLLHARELEFSDVDRCLAALRRYKAAKGDFADYLIAQETWDRGGDALVTFDATLLAEEGFIAPK